MVASGSVYEYVALTQSLQYGLMGLNQALLIRHIGPYCKSFGALLLNYVNHSLQ